MSKLLALLLVFCSVLPLGAQGLYFPPTIGNQWETISPSALDWCPEKIDSLYDMLEENNTHAFIILKDGKMVLEKYFTPFGRDSIWYWASAGKSLTALLTGIAQEQGHLNITDAVSGYIGEGWTSCADTDEERITIEHQLTMTTGFNDGVTDPSCTLDTCLACMAELGNRWAYHNAPYTLLTEVINTSTEQSLNGFMQSRVTDLTGINGLYLPLGYNKVFFSRARDMARFGLLILNAGVWSGVDILSDTSFFNQMVNTAQNYNQSYGYLWWLNGKESFMLPSSQFVFPGSIVPDAPSDMIAAMGKNGQYINVVPSQNMVVVRMGNAPDEAQVPNVLNNKIWAYINNLKCPVATNELIDLSAVCSIYPNPSSEYFTISLPNRSFDILLYNILGEEVWQQSGCFDHEQVQAERSQGMYLINVRTEGDSFMKKVIINH